MWRSGINSGFRSTEIKVNWELVSSIAGIVIANFVSVVGAYVSMKVAIARQEVLVGKLEKDVDNLARMYRREYFEEQNEREKT